MGGSHAAAPSARSVNPKCRAIDAICIPEIGDPCNRDSRCAAAAAPVAVPTTCVLPLLMLKETASSRMWRRKS